MKIRPTCDQILVQRDAEDTVNPGGVIVIPDAAHNKQLPRGRGVVLAVGLGLKHPKTGARIPMDCKVGDRIVCSKLSGDKVRDDLAQLDVEADLFLIREEHVIAIVDSDD